MRLTIETGADTQTQRDYVGADTYGRVHRASVLYVERTTAQHGAEESVQTG